MGSVPRPLLGLLVATVAFFALWTVALKGRGSSSGSGSSSNLSGYQSDINAAKNVQTVVNSAAAKAGGTPSTTSTPVTTTTAPTHSAAAASGSAAPAVHNATAPAKRGAAKPSTATPVVPAVASTRLSAAAAALKENKVLALLFYNPAAPDDQLVKRELAVISTHRGRVVKLAIPLDELPNYAVVTSQVPVNFSPTLVIVDAAKQAQEITGYSDSFEISQRIDDALAAGAKS